MPTTLRPDSNRQAPRARPVGDLGGLSSGGLGFTDTGNKAVIGGLAREFYHRIYQHYQAWQWQERASYGNKGQGTPAIDGNQRTMWIFEPHVAEAVFQSFVDDYEIPVHPDEWFDREGGVTKEGARINAIRMLSGMEPVFMILGESATAAGMAIDSGIAIQDLPYPSLRDRLLEQGQVLQYA